MKIKEIYEAAVDLGISKGPRSKKEYLEILKEAKEAYEKLDKIEKEYFDKECFANPFADSRVLYGEPNKNIKTALVGIDIDVQELLLIKELERQGVKIDMAISHHPTGKALAALSSTMKLQEDIMQNAGIPINIIEKLLEPRIKEVSRTVAPLNKERVIDAAKLLDIPLACFHTVADNQVHDYLEKFLAKRKIKYVKDIIEALREIPEYKQAIAHGAGPAIFAGCENSRAGKIAVTGMTGGTEGTEEIYEQLSRAGVGTIVDMHISEGRRKKAETYHLNVVVAGHMASDSLGMNLIMDKIEKKGVKIIPCSGFIRIRR